MKIYGKEAKGVHILELEGKITIGVGDVMLRETVEKLLQLGQNKILLNMSRVSYMDSSGVGELIATLQNVKQQGGDLKLLNISTKIKDLLHIAQILTVFEYFNDEETAVNSF
jgi:anti-sigma B factor antagonist